MRKYLTSYRYCDARRAIRAREGPVGFIVQFPSARTRLRTRDYFVRTLIITRDLKSTLHVCLAEQSRKSLAYARRVIRPK